MKDQTIKISGDRVFLNGQSDIPSSLQNILTASEDFRIVSHKNGTVEFERVGEANELKFPMVGEPTFMTVNFDSHVIKVVSSSEYGTYEWTTSGQELSVGWYGGTTYYATVTLEDGYEIDTVTTDDTNYNLLTFSGNVISFRTISAGMGFGFTITTKAAATKQTIDVSTLSGWANLATGNHQITIKTKASGYADSASSNAVTVAKAASGYKVYISGSQDTTMGGYAYYSTDNGATWENLAGGYGWSATDELVGTFTQIKFKIEADTHKLVPYCDLSSTALGLSLSASNGETKISDNYELTKDITDLTFTAAGP